MPVEQIDRLGRKDPEALLRHAQAAERAQRRGRLKIFLGYASGVGKSFTLFDEGRRRRRRGEDVVVAAMQPHNDADVLEVVNSLESIAASVVDGVPVIDVLAVLKRRPAVCLVDGLASDNPVGSRHAKRHLDVEELLEHGISVLTSINLEHIEEQQDFVRSITGKLKTATVPETFVTGADEIVVVDAPADGGFAGGVGTNGNDAAPRVSRLRERALLLAADVVDQQLEAYLELNGIESSWGTQERILVCLTPRANAAAMLASGRRNADRFHGELFAVYVKQSNLTAEDRMALHRNVVLGRAQDVEVDILDGKDPVGTILEYARARGITQIFVGHNLKRTWRARFRGSPLDRLIRDAEGMDVRVFPH